MVDDTKLCNVQNNKTYNFVVLCRKISFYGGGHEFVKCTKSHMAP
jgi:hypothetical protein